MSYGNQNNKQGGTKIIRSNKILDQKWIRWSSSDKNGAEACDTAD
jgi:hypothetical protein